MNAQYTNDPVYRNRETSSNINPESIDNNIKSLFILWIAFMVATIIISITFQLLLASSPVQKLVAVLLGVIMPMATSIFLSSAIYLFIFKRIGFGLFAGLIFLSSFVWEFHSHYSFWSEAMEKMSEKSELSKAQTDMLKTIDEQLANMPIAGAVFTDSIDSEIRRTEEALQLCPQGHATKCIIPLTKKLGKLYERQKENGVQAQVLARRNELLQSRQDVLKQKTGSTSDDRLENAKAMSVFKNVSRLFYGDISAAKNIEAYVNAFFSMLCTIIASGLLGIRTRLMIDANMNVFSLDGYYENRRTENNSQPESRIESTVSEQMQNEIQPEIKTETQPEIERKNIRVKINNPELDNIFQQSPTYAQPSAYNANISAASANPLFQASVVAPRPVFSLIKNTDAVELRHGISEFKPFDDAYSDKPAEPVEVNTTSKFIMKGAGFGAALVRNPNYKDDSDAVNAVEVNAVECSQIDADGASKQMQSDAEESNKSSASGGSKTSLKGLADLKECVLSSDVLFWRNAISNRKVQDFMKCGQDKASEYIDALKADCTLNADGTKNANA